MGSHLYHSVGGVCSAEEIPHVFLGVPEEDELPMALFNSADPTTYSKWWPDRNPIKNFYCCV